MLKKDYFRKNLLRVKQIADQNLGRAEKTEVLTEDLVQVEKRVDLFKQVCQTTVKKISGCMQGQGTDTEKRLKKIPEMALSQSMAESANLLGEETLTGNIFHMCADSEGKLGKELMTYEMDVEQNVLTPLQSLLENEIPGIAKTRKQLTKLTLDMDSAKSRWQTAVRQSQASGTNMAHAAAKAENIKDELEDAQTRVEQCRDALATEMFNFISREAEYCQKVLHFVEAQAEYHRNALYALENMIPELKGAIEQHPFKPVYGHSLAEHCHVTEREIAWVIEECVCTLLEIGMDEEGLFRIAGSGSKVKKLKAAFDAGIVDMSEHIRDIHCIAGAFKLYLRELPEPLLTYELYSEWMQAAQIKDVDQRLQALWIVTQKLPKVNFDNLRYLIKFLAKVAENSEVNKMTSSNVAIVIGPNLIWASNEDGPNVLTTGTQSSIVESMISHADWFFPGDIDFNISSSSDASSSQHGYGAGVTASPKSDREQNLHGAVPGSNESVNSLNTSSVSANTSMDSSNASLQVTPSPKIPRRATKKPAPPPPVQDKPTRVSDSSSEGHPAPPTAPPPAPPVEAQDISIVVPSSPEVHVSMGGPPIPDRPNVAPPDRPHGPPPERPHGPPPERPHGPPPDKPTSDQTKLPEIHVLSSEKSQDHPPDRPKTVPPERPSGPPPERPPQPPLRQGSANKPSRPQPPPPPPPGSKERSNSHNEETHL